MTNRAALASRISIFTFSLFVTTLSYPIRGEASKDEVANKISLPIQLEKPLIGGQKIRFGDGWARAYVQTMNGDRIQLFPGEELNDTGGILFERFDRSNISPSGDYAVLPLLRQGTLEIPGEKARVSGREYCPIVEMHTGCIVNMQTGGICGGQWAPKRDEWIDENTDRTSEILRRSTMSAPSLWKSFSSSRVNIKIGDLLDDNLGVTNVLACDPVSDGNKVYYHLIASQLGREARSTDAKKIEGELSGWSPVSKKWEVKVEKAPLYDSDSEGSKTRMYLVKGDVVSELRRQPTGWVQIEYVAKNRRVITKWIHGSDLEMQ